MRIFFYSRKRSGCGVGCHWQLCPQRYLAKLRTSGGLQDVYPIFGEVSYLAPHAHVIPRSGDIIILYAENNGDLERMIEVRDGFDGLKKIVVVGDPTGIDGARYHMLAPRFITQAQRNIGELEDVVRRMKGYLN